MLKKEPWVGYVRPTKIFGNLYFVGTHPSSVHLIDTGDGLMLIDTGYLAMMDATVTMEIQKIKGLKNAMFGGEGMFNTLVTGPGRVVLQTMPISGFAAFIASLLPKKG